MQSLTESFEKNSLCHHGICKWAIKAVANICMQDIQTYCD